MSWMPAPLNRNAARHPRARAPKTPVSSPGIRPLRFFFNPVYSQSAQTTVSTASAAIITGRALWMLLMSVMPLTL